MTNRSADVVVVGCGALGLSAARSLALGGATVIAIDRAAPGSQTSARAAGQSVVVQADDAVGDLMSRSLQAFVDLADDAPGFRVHRVGSVKLAASRWAAVQLRREVSRAQARGVRVELIDREAVTSYAPYVDAAAVQLAWHSPDDLYFHPPALLSTLLAATRAAGVTVLDHLDVLAIVTHHGRFIEVVTQSGPLRAGAALIAAGPWTGALLETVGVRVPTTLVRHQFTLRGPGPGIDPELPIVRIVDDATYARPDGHHVVLGRYEPAPMVVEAGELPRDTAGLALDPRLIDDAPFATSVFAHALSWPLAEVRGGVVTMSPDGGYIVDDAGIEGLHFITGCNVRGLTVAPALGHDVARWMLTGERPDSLEPFSLQRFTRPLARGDERAAGLRQYANIYLDRESADVRAAQNHTPRMKVAPGA